MVIKYRLPSSLQHGDAVELQGRAGDERMVVDLLSDHFACDPGKKDKIADPDDPTAEDIPMAQTQPLQIVLETVGTWDVNASSPFSSTSSHGTTAKRFGFRPGENFVCTILIRPEHFEIRLNEMPFASSEHLVPVGSIHGIQFDGDATITAIRFGHPMAIEQYNMCSPHPAKNGTAANVEHGVASIVECRMATDETLQEAYRLDSIMDMRKIGGEFSKSTFELFTPGEEREKTGQNLHGLPGLQRATSYQLVFDLDESDPEDRENVTNLGKNRRTKSQFNLCRTALSNQLIDMDGDVQKPVIKIEEKKNTNNLIKNRMKHVSSSLARKVNGKLAENSNGIKLSNNDSMIPKCIKRPLLQFESTERFVERRLGSTVGVRSRNDTSSRGQNVSFVTNETQVGRQVRQRPVYKATLPFEVERLEQISDEDSISYVPAHRVVFRGKSNTFTNSNKLTNAWNGGCGNFSESYADRSSERDPRRATYTAGQLRQSMAPVPIRSPLTLLDQQWDQILPVISHKPESTGVNSILSTENTISSNSEENRPPYVHWYTQMKQRSRPISMIICDDTSVLPSVRSGLENNESDLILPSKPVKLTKETLSEQDDRYHENQMSSVIKNVSDTLGQINGDRHRDDAPNLQPKVGNGSIRTVDDICKMKTNGHSPIMDNPSRSIDHEGDNPDEPVLLIDCIPMDADVCVVQQPMEAWPAKAVSPELPQVLKSWGNGLNLQLESRTFSQPTDDLLAPVIHDTDDDDDGLGENTESLLSDITMHTEYGTMSNAFDEVVDHPGHSIHDPRSPENGISNQSHNFVLSPKLPKVANLNDGSVSMTPRSYDMNSSFHELEEPELTSLTSSFEIRRTERPKSVSNGQSKLPTRTPSDLRRMIMEKKQCNEIPHKIVQPGDTFGSHTPHNVTTATIEKKRNVSKLFRGFQGRHSFLGGKAGLKPGQNTDESGKMINSQNMTTVDRHSTPVYKSNTNFSGNVKSNGITNADSSTKIKAQNDNIKQFVQSPKKWLSKKLNAVKL